jgi:hypothetical protein
VQRDLDKAVREMELELRDGTFSDYFHVTASVPVVAGSGTGAYRGIGGSFSLTLTGNEDQKSPPCQPGFASQILVLIGSGTVSS